VPNQQPEGQLHKQHNIQTQITTNNAQDTKETDTTKNKQTNKKINFFNQRMHFLFSYFCSIHPTYVSAVTLPSSRYIDKFTSLFTGPFGIITTVTLFKAIIHIDNHRCTQLLQVVS
jgi:hypothetical protein